MNISLRTSLRGPGTWVSASEPLSEGGRIIDNLQIDNRQIDNLQIDNQQIDNRQIDNLTNFRQIDNRQIDNLTFSKIYSAIFFN